MLLQGRTEIEWRLVHLIKDSIFARCFFYRHQDIYIYARESWGHLHVEAKFHSLFVFVSDLYCLRPVVY